MHDVKHNFNLASRGYRFCLLTYVIAFTCKELELDPSKLEDSVEMPFNERLNRMNAIADSLVDFEWVDVLQNTLQMR